VKLRENKIHRFFEKGARQKKLFFPFFFKKKQGRKSPERGIFITFQVLNHFLTENFSVIFAKKKFSSFCFLFLKNLSN